LDDGPAFSAPGQPATEATFPVDIVAAKPSAPRAGRQFAKLGFDIVLPIAAYYVCRAAGANPWSH
jgi:hypothetical protein